MRIKSRQPLLNLKTYSAIDSSLRIYDEELTRDYFQALHELCTSGVSFAGQTCLVTGAGGGSIALDVVKALLEGGATVVATVWHRFSDARAQTVHKLYKKAYEEHGSKHSRLICPPCNCASAQDVRSVVDYVMGDLGLDLDFVIPFSAASEVGRTISEIDGHSDMAHRMMLANVIRMIGRVKEHKARMGIVTRPAMVLLPCSPNHGVFGSDGLYAESKLGLEALYNKWHSEGWQDYIVLALASIGWTRSQLMMQNNIIAPDIERLGCQTFTTEEMAYNLLGLLHPKLVERACDEPLFADLTGGWKRYRLFMK